MAKDLKSVEDRLLTTEEMLASAEARAVVVESWQRSVFAHLLALMARVNSEPPLASFGLERLEELKPERYYADREEKAQEG